MEIISNIIIKKLKDVLISFRSKLNCIDFSLIEVENDKEFNISTDGFKEVFDVSRILLLHDMIHDNNGNYDLLTIVLLLAYLDTYHLLPMESNSRRILSDGLFAIIEDNLFLTSSYDISIISKVLREKISNISGNSSNNPFEYMKLLSVTKDNSLADSRSTCSFSNSSNSSNDKPRSSRAISKTTDSSNKMVMSIWTLSFEYHKMVFDCISKLSTSANPRHVSLPGDKKSFIQVSSFTMAFRSAYTFISWLYIEEDANTSVDAMKGFVLFRVRTASGGIDTILSDKTSDGRWQVIIRSFREVVRGTSTIYKEEVQGTIYLPSNKWHLVAVRHTQTFMKKPVVSFIIDGVLEWENELSYPLNNTSSDSQWIVGLGLHGKIASFALYAESLDTPLLKLLFDQGFWTSRLDFGVRYPQSSFDTGYTTLGSISMKGPLAFKAVRSNLTFLVDTFYILSTYDSKCPGEVEGIIEEAGVDKLSDLAKGLPVVSTSFINVDKIAMVYPAISNPTSSKGTSNNTSTMIIPLLAGDCKLFVKDNCIDFFLSHGGTLNLLYLLWGYCNATNNSGEISDILRIIKSILGYLAFVLEKSGELREQFIQQHGFHVLSYCLSAIKDKGSNIDLEIVNCLLHIILAFGIDSKRGDCICSALQGLLFDLQLWNECSVNVKMTLVNIICDLTKNNGDMLYKYIGFQRVLDFIRMCIVFPMTLQVISENTITHSNASDLDTSIRCIDSSYRLLLICIESSKIFAQKSKASSIFLNIPNMILVCIDEMTQQQNMTVDYYNKVMESFIEKLLLCLMSIKVFNPSVLLKAFQSYNFVETTSIVLLAKRVFSFEIRKLVLTLVLWFETETNHQYIQAISMNVKQFLQLGQVDKKGNLHRSELKRLHDILLSYQDSILPIVKIYNIMKETSLLINEAIDIHGLWSSKSLIDDSVVQKYHLEMAMDTILESFSFDIANSGSGAHAASGTGSNSSQAIKGYLPILTLPFLPVFLSKCSLLCCQRVLMSLNVAFKTDESQVDSIVALEEDEYLTIFVQLAIIGETYAPAVQSLDEFLNAYPIYEQDNCRVAATCTELALDTLSTILERKLRCSFPKLKNSKVSNNNSNNSPNQNTWSHLKSIIDEQVQVKLSHFSLVQRQAIERKYLQRCLALVFQRISKSTEGWNVNILNNVTIMLQLTYLKQLCRNKFLTSNRNIDAVISQNTGSLNASIDLLNFNESNSGTLGGGNASIKESLQGNELQSNDERQILCFSMDILQSLRKTTLQYIMTTIPSSSTSASFSSTSSNSSNNSYLSLFRGKEWYVMQQALCVILGCLTCVSANTADRISRELLAQIKYMTNPFVTSVIPIFTSENFLTFLSILFISLRQAYFDASSTKDIKDCYYGLVYNIFTHFRELQQPAGYSNTPSKSSSKPIELASYVVDMKEIFAGFEMSSDISVMFGQLDMELPVTSQTITSFVPTDMTLFPIPNLSPMKQVSIVTEEALQTDTSITSNLVDDLVDMNTFANDSSMNLTKEDSSILIETNLNEASWWQIREGILLDRVACEKDRINDILHTYQIYVQAISKFWKKNQRKVEIEVYYDNHYQKCHWKLGIAHEGQQPSRKRVVLRPTFNISYGVPTVPQDDDGPLPHYGSGDGKDNPLVEDIEELSKKLGSIKDVTMSETVVGDIDPIEDDSFDETSSNIHGNANTNSSHSSSQWGIVDMDYNDEEGNYGVIGTATSNINTNSNSDTITNTNSPENTNSQLPHDSNLFDKTTNVSAYNIREQYNNDMLGDIRYVEAAIAQGRRLDTGPCLPGTRRIIHGTPILQNSCILITPSCNIFGILGFNEKEIFFTSSTKIEDIFKEDFKGSENLKVRRRRWAMNSISAIYLRRYRLRDTAIEVFFKRGKHKSFFVDFGHLATHTKIRNNFAKYLMNYAPRSCFKQWISMPLTRLVHEGGGVNGGEDLLDKWMNHEISNFEYIMSLNSLAGRTFNDLCQYPVFPWVIGQYNEPTIDLSNPATYRDLSKPMGALNPARLNEFLSRYHSFAENIHSDIPPFMYGSHFSTMVGVVLHFLVRLEPFASLHQEMQTGHFDVADRLFASIPRTYEHNTNQLSEVKELTPEWFTNPNIFRNLNQFNFGVTQDGTIVDDVELPPWATSPEEFIRINMEALESDFVSQHLHQWIDLIFGYKQVGPDSIEANNVFYYLTYYGTVNRDLITDDSLRRAIELQIAHFGQMPIQLFKTPHPQRKTLNQSMRSISRLLSQNFVLPNVYPIPRLINSSPSNCSWIQTKNYEEHLIINSVPILYQRTTTRGSNNSKTSSKCCMISVHIHTDRLIVLLNDGIIDVYKYSTSEETKTLISNHKTKVLKARRLRGLGNNLNTNSNTNSNHIPIVGSNDDPMLFYSSETETEEESLSNDINNLLDVEVSTSTTNSTNNRIEQPILNISHELLTTSTSIEVIPHIPLPLTSSFNKSINAFQGRYPISNQMIFTKGNKLLVIGGYVDGRIHVCNVDPMNGSILDTGDFSQHKRRVIAMASDAMFNSSTDVVASVDIDGVILIWAVTKVNGLSVDKNEESNQSTISNETTSSNHETSNSQSSNMSMSMNNHLIVNTNTSSSCCIIFRHPQRRFKILPMETLCCDISANIGIMVCCGSNICHLFSIERDEKLHEFIISIDEQGNNSLIYYPKHVVISDDGFIAISCHVFHSNQQNEVNLTSHVLVYSTSGHKTNELIVSSVTCMLCPSHGNTILLGHVDGSVSIRLIANIDIVLFVFEPYKSCIEVFDSSSSSSYSNIKTMKASPIIHIAIGPDPLHPNIITMTSLDGEIYIQPLVDFIQWERNRIPSTLSQLVTGQLQAVKGLISTTNLMTQNVRQYADEALTELKKNVWKGVGNWFGKKKE